MESRSSPVSTADKTGLPGLHQAVGALITASVAGLS